MEQGNFSLDSAKGYWALFLYEFFGTGLLLLAVNFSRGNPLVVMAGIYQACLLTARQTGAHFNMGLTCAVFIAENQYAKHWKAFFVYHVAELLGSFAG